MPIKAILFSVLLIVMALPASAQRKKSADINDSNTPLHLLQPDYAIPYGALTTAQVKSDMDRVLHYLEANTPARIVDKRTGKPISDFSRIDEHAQLEPGAFRLTSYEWGVTYSAMLAAAKATGDTAYEHYAVERLKLLAEAAPAFERLVKEGKTIDPVMRKVVNPGALDDAGAVCVAMIKAMQQYDMKALKPVVDRYADYIMHREYRLSDGTLARTRPHYNTVWLDDMFMGIPTLARYALVAEKDGEVYLNEAIRQVNQFAERMWVSDKKLFRHGWVEGMKDHPAFHWGRANGWAVLTLCEVLDVLPKDHPQRPKLMKLYRNHIRGIAAVQSGQGFWHQLLDRNDSYLETSATAIFVYAIAHGINQGWLDAMAYGPVAQLGWQAVTTKINARGQVEGTCVGTGMGFDPAFYYHRPVHAMAAHGYGPVIWAGAEMINLLNSQHPRMNDSAIQYYATEQPGNDAIFHATDPKGVSEGKKVEW